MPTKKLLKTIIKQTILEFISFPVVKDPTMSWSNLSQNFYQPTREGQRFWDELKHYQHRNDPEYQNHRYGYEHTDNRQSQREIAQAIKDEVPKNWQAMSKESQIIFFIKAVKSQINRRRFHGGRLPTEMVEGWYRYYYNVFFGTKPEERTLNKEKNPHEITFQQIMDEVNEGT